MVDLSLFSYREAIDMILIFYSVMEGYFDEDLDDNPQVKMIINMGYTDKTEDEMYVLSETGKDFFHEYIKDISEKFIEFMNKTGNEAKYGDAYEWYKQEFELESIDDAEDICEYITKNLYHYGYTISKGYSSRKGHFYRMEKCKRNNIV